MAYFDRAVYGEPDAPNACYPNSGLTGQSGADGVFNRYSDSRTMISVSVHKWCGILLRLPRYYSAFDPRRSGIQGILPIELGSLRPKRAGDPAGGRLTHNRAALRFSEPAHLRSPRTKPAPAAFLESRRGRRSTDGTQYFRFGRNDSAWGFLVLERSEIDSASQATDRVNFLPNARREVSIGLRCPPRAEAVLLGHSSLSRRLGLKSRPQSGGAGEPAAAGIAQQHQTHKRTPADFADSAKGCRGHSSPATRAWGFGPASPSCSDP
jgi:hypothetical protein